MTSDPLRFLEDVSGRYAASYFEAIHSLYVAHVRGNRPAAFDARDRLAEAMAASMGVADILGSTLALRAAAGQRRAHFEGGQSIMPRVTFDEALDDFVSRAPVTFKDAAERTANRIAALYAKDRVVSFVRSADAVVTAEAQRFIATALRTGIGEGEAGQRLAMTVEQVRDESEAWSEGYARMVFRTNANTAVTAGRFRQARDPDVQWMIPAMRFSAVGDADTRPNHRAMNGVILSVENPAWKNLAAPLGYNCRCRVEHVTRFDLAADGRLREDGSVVESSIPAGAGPDPGFRQ